MTAMKLIVFVTALLALTNAANTKIQPKLSASLQTKGTANILVSFVGGNAAALRASSNRALQGRTDRITFLKQQLEQHTSTSQENVQDLLNSRGVAFKSFWISNQIYVEGATRELVETLAEFSEIKRVIEEPLISLDPGFENEPVKGPRVSKKDDELVWSLKTIDVETAWKYTNGSGVVVGHIDSGVLSNHEALRDNFVGEDYGWFDPLLNLTRPYDGVGHGTHTMGTIVGTKGIGVAPGAKWMTCQACPHAFICAIPFFIKCAEWMLCPTKANWTDPDCSKAPHLISNSWGGLAADGDDFFDEVGAAWHEAGIIPIFALGNEGRGKNCSTTRHPGGEEYVIGVGATNIKDEIADFSSLGPGPGGIKPDLSAPGDNITSAYPSDPEEEEMYNGYRRMSGTSMACPATSGVAVLMLSINPNLTFAEMKHILTTSGVDSSSLVSHNTTCGGTSDKEFPNNIFGYGRINAGKAVLATIQTLNK